MQLIDHSLSDLGQLAPSEDIPGGDVILQHNQVVIVNGVELPNHVAEELRMLGIPMGSYSNGQLEAAIIASHYDRQVFDDDKGISFADKLTLTRQEKMNRDSDGADKNEKPTIYSL